MIMFIGAVTARLPVAVVLGLAIPMVSAVVARLREDTSALPSTRSRDWRVSELSESLAAWTEAYAAYLNTPRDSLDPDERPTTWHLRLAATKWR
jgi:hypothetical protein